MMVQLLLPWNFESPPGVPETTAADPLGSLLALLRRRCLS